jgi:hypothetical protein
MKLDDEGLQATRLLEGRVVKTIHRHTALEVMVEFTDGSRLFVDWREDRSLELSITGDFENGGQVTNG